MSLNKIYKLKFLKPLKNEIKKTNQRNNKTKKEQLRFEVKITHDLCSHI